MRLTLHGGDEQRQKSAAGGIAAKPPSNSVSLAFFLW